MKNFPSVLAVVGAWLCSLGFVLPGILAFMLSSIWAIFVLDDVNVWSVAFFTANIVAFLRMI
jgi:hypothetical protein